MGECLVPGDEAFAHLFLEDSRWGNDVRCESDRSDRNVVRVIFYLRNNIDKVEAEATSNNHRLRELRVEYVNRARSPLLEGKTSCPMFVGLYKPLINFGG